MTIFPHSQPTFLHILIPSWQLAVSMHQIGSLIRNKHDKLIVKMTILFLLCGGYCRYMHVQKILYTMKSIIQTHKAMQETSF